MGAFHINMSGVEFNRRSLLKIRVVRYRENGISCVLKVITLAGSLLLTGHVKSAGERALMADADALSSDAVVVPHPT